jgi:hypothetical protein
MDVGFIVLCPDRSPAGLKNSVGSVRYNCYDRDCIAVVPKAISPKEIVELKEYCPAIYKGQDTITSLINTGMKRLKNEWGFLMFAGSRVPSFIERKLKSFVKSDRDVLYPIVEDKYNFVEGAFNGVLVNKAFFKEVGDFPTATMQKAGLNDFEFAKLLWALDALDHNVVFKGIVGMRTI